MEYCVGVAASVITPPIGAVMMGFANRDHGAEGIHDDLYARALWVQGDGRPLVIIAVDLAALSPGQVALVKQDLIQSCGVPAQHVLINCTHTHAGPLTDERFYASGPPDPAYVSRVRQVIAGAALAARASAQPASLRFGLGETDIGIGRGLPTDAGYVMAPNPEQPINRDALAVRIDGADGKPLAVLFSVSCHPTALGRENCLISSEFPGVACREIERQLPGARAIFLQGAGADIKPRQTADLVSMRFRSGDFEDVEVVGRHVASDILEVLHGALESLTEPLGARFSHARLPFDLPARPEAYYESAIGSQAPEYQRQWARYHLARLRENGLLPPSADCPVQLLHFGRALAIAAFGGELCSGHAHNVRQALLPTPCHTIGYSNGVIGYLPTDQALRRGGYEAAASGRSSAPLPAPFSPGIDSRLIDALLRLDCGADHA